MEYQLGAMFLYTNQVILPYMIDIEGKKIPEFHHVSLLLFDKICVIQIDLSASSNCLK